MPFAYMPGLTALEASVAANLAAINALNDLSQAQILGDATPFNGASIAAILADVTGIAGAAMRGTDGSFLAASLVQYTYENDLAANTAFLPPNKTIIMSTALHQAADDELRVMLSSTLNRMAFKNLAAAGHPNGYIGTYMCDGTTEVHNNDPAQAHILELLGLTIA